MRESECRQAAVIEALEKALAQARAGEVGAAAIVLLTEAGGRQLDGLTFLGSAPDCAGNLVDLLCGMVDELDGSPETERSIQVTAPGSSLRS